MSRIREIVLCFVVAQAATSLWAAAPAAGLRWELADGREATALIVNHGSAAAWVQLQLMPRGKAGVISPLLRLKPGQEMAFNLRYFFPDSEGTKLQGRLKVRRAPRRGSAGRPRVEVTLLTEELSEGSLVQSGSQTAQSSEEVFDPCDEPDACDEGPDYVEYDRFEYREWDVDGDGVTDPGQRSSLIVFDSNDNITWAESIYALLFPQSSSQSTYDWFCSEQVQGNCIVERCSIVEYRDSVETGRTIVGSDFMEIISCPDEEPRTEVFDEDVSLDSPELFYSGCVQAASLHFNSAMDAEVMDARQDLVDILREFLGVSSAASGITIGGVLKQGPKKVVGKFIRAFPGGRFLWDELRAIDRGRDAQLFVREQACAWVTAERLCYQKMQETFGPVQLQRNDIYAILDFKNVNTDVVRRHCRQP